AHEAAHGWFGNGVRIACWEDFLLAEGTTSYVAVRALEQVGGPVLWPEQVRWLDSLCAEPRTPVLLDTCGMIDIVGHPIVSGLPYAKGACFFEDVGDQIGPDALDRVLADFYRAHVGGAATMRELLAELMAAHPGQARAIDALASDWLRSPTCPADYATRCGRHIR
ncbi:MAG: M1 family aminopeptidase, partial [Myxococcota bacterium]